MSRKLIRLGATSFLILTCLSTSALADEDFFLSPSTDSTDQFSRRWWKLEDQVGQKIVQQLEIPKARPRLRRDTSFLAALHWVGQRFFGTRMRQGDFLTDFGFEKNGAYRIGTCQVKVTLDQRLNVEKTEIAYCEYRDSKDRPVSDQVMASLFPGKDFKKIGTIEDHGSLEIVPDSNPAISAYLVKESRESSTKNAVAPAEETATGIVGISTKD